MFAPQNQQIHIILRFKIFKNNGAITDHIQNSDCCLDDGVRRYPGYALLVLAAILALTAHGYVNVVYKSRLNVGQLDGVMHPNIIHVCIQLILSGPWCAV